MLQIIPGLANTTVTVVGDTHGQFHDVVRMLQVAGAPSADRLYIINGDMVDRGSWGLETLLLFCLYKLSLANEVQTPVTILRGNHETATCSIIYGFKQEIEAKYGKSDGRRIFNGCKQLFKNLPLAALVNNRTLVLHGGLFRKRRGRKRVQKKKYLTDDDEFSIDEPNPVIGSLADLRAGSKGGLDATGLGESQLAADVLWSDPSNEPGLSENYARGIGMVFGPEVTEKFLEDNGLRLIIRSHEGPDARESRPEMQNMLEGYTIDHQSDAGKLMTVFSAPDYPQHLPDTQERYKNKAAVLVLNGIGDYACPDIKQYDAVLPRPSASPYYELDVPDSDEEIEMLEPTASGMTDFSTDQVDIVGEGQRCVDSGKDEATTAFCS
jgi:serine/threonine-protein phosphatase 5